MKKVVAVLFMLIVLVSCSNDQTTPNERFQLFVDHWENGEFNQLYNLFSHEAQATYSKEDSTDRLQKIYNDLSITDVQISFEELNEEQVETAFDEGSTEIPFTVQMESMAGPIQFDYDATLVFEGEEEEKNWFVQWDSGYIFPDLKDGGEIQIRTTTAERGEILDRNQMPLALNDQIYEVGVVPEKLSNPESAKKRIAELLGMSLERIDSALHADWVQPSYFVPLKKISSHKQGTVDQLLQIDGVMVNTVQGRVYPSGEAAAHLVGYLRQVTAEDLENDKEGKYNPNDVIGARGLEQLYDDVLRGENGVQIIVVKEDGEETILAEKPVIDGENIQVTIDVNIQEKIFATYEGEAGTTAAIHPKTGETLALISSPSFDPNEVMYGTDSTIWKRLENDPQLPLINRFASTYIPGSVIKPVTAMIGLQNGTIHPKEGIEINGLTWTKGKEWGDYKVTRVSTSNRPVDLKDAMARSDNIYFAMQAINMGADAYEEGMKKFGFESELPYEYPITASTISNSGEIDDEILLADSSYGQGEVQISSLHMASMYTPILNDGNMIKPTLLMSEETGQIWQENLITKEQAEILQDSLRAVVTDGTAKGANKADFAISGKTGTAELKLTADQQGAENSWFVAYPTEEQDILIAMMIENTQGKSSSYIVEKVTDLLTLLRK